MASEPYDAVVVGSGPNGLAAAITLAEAGRSVHILEELNPYATPDPSIFICSAATPPGGGVHGMCGVNAARAVLRSRLR